MNIKVSLIKNPLARRTAMCVLFPVLAALTPALGLVRGFIEMLNLMEALVRSWRPVWRGDGPEIPHAEVGVLGGELRIHIPVDLLAYAAEHSPAAQGHLSQDVSPAAYAAGKFRVTDPLMFAKSVGLAIRETTGMGGETMLHQMLDDAVEQVIENADAGFVWPFAGIGVLERETLPVEHNAPLD